MISKKKALQMIDVIADMFPNAECELNHRNAIVSLNQYLENIEHLKII